TRPAARPPAHSAHTGPGWPRLQPHRCRCLPPDPRTVLRPNQVPWSAGPPPPAAPPPAIAGIRRTRPAPAARRQRPKPLVHHGGGTPPARPASPRLPGPGHESGPAALRTGHNPAGSCPAPPDNGETPARVRRPDADDGRG